jgi:hypothetical protein
MADTKSPGRQFVIEFLRSPEGQRIAPWLASVASRLGECAAWVVTMNEWMDRVRLGPNFEALFEDGEDWLWRPVSEGTCRAESIIDGTLTLEHIAILNALIDAREAHAKATPAVPTKIKGSRRRRGGGRPATVTKAVETWWKALSPDDLRLSDAKLAALWKSDPSHSGDTESVRQIIGKLRRRPA